MKAWPLLGLLALAGCGSGSTLPADELEGTWTFDIDADEGAGLTFLADGTYLTQHIFVVSPNVMQDQAEQGTFVADGSTLTTFPERSTCPGAWPASSVRYSVTASTLLLVDGATSATFARLPPSPPTPNLTIAFGCFAADGSFTPRELLPVD